MREISNRIGEKTLISSGLICGEIFRFRIISCRVSSEKKQMNISRKTSWKRMQFLMLTVLVLDCSNLKRDSAHIHYLYNNRHSMLNRKFQPASTSALHREWFMLSSLTFLNLCWQLKSRPRSSQNHFNLTYKSVFRSLCAFDNLFRNAERAIFNSLTERSFTEPLRWLKVLWRNYEWLYQDRTPVVGCAV